jgi:hypothetical protein
MRISEEKRGTGAWQGDKNSEVIPESDHGQSETDFNTEKS